jgi:hypothetical protein
MHGPEQVGIVLTLMSSAMVFYMSAGKVCQTCLVF